MRFRPLLWPTVWTVPALALLIGLGVWQLERREWKLALIADITAELKKPPVQMDTLEAAAKAGEKVAYHPVIVSGRLDNAHELYLYVAAPEDGSGGPPGYHVITPLLRVSGPTVLVDRGYVPETLKAPDMRVAGQIADLVTIRGVARQSSPPGLFTPAPEIAQRVWHSRDLATMAKALGPDPVAPFFVEADATENPGGWPRGGQTRVTLRNEHLTYALTWFGLAATLLGVYLVYHRRNGRLD